jgi:hypothetical protein
MFVEIHVEYFIFVEIHVEYFMFVEIHVEYGLPCALEISTFLSFIPLPTFLKYIKYSAIGAL